MVCQDSNTIIANGGQVIENSDGTVSVYIMNSNNVLSPSILNKQCCLALNPLYTYDIYQQKCLWTPNSGCSISDVFKISLNPQGNEGSIFYVDDDETCNLKVEFDYLVKIKCETLSNILTDGINGLEDLDPDLYAEIVSLEIQIEQQTIECEILANQIAILNEQINNTPYSIICNQENFIQICLTETDGLAAWSQILGEVNYYAFINGDQNSYSCEDAQQLITQNTINLSSFPQGPLLAYDCNVPFGAKTDLINQIEPLLKQQIGCQTLLSTLTSELLVLQQQSNALLTNICVNPVDMFESLDMSVTVDVIDSDGGVNTVYELFDFFSPIGEGQLYQYLTTNTNSGFYVCSDPDCQPLYLNLTGLPIDNTTSCENVSQSLVTSLFAQSNLQDVEDGLNMFNLSLSNSAFASQWVQYSTTISDENILSLINNQQIKFSIKINHTCADICVLIDNIKLTKECTSVSERSIFVTNSPGFILERIIDNKKSWVKKDAYELRTFDIKNAIDTDPIRQTSYDLNDERLIINTKEIDLNVNLASAIETDVWCYLIDNPCLFTGDTNCIICSGDSKQFQSDEYFDFMDGALYEFMDDDDDTFNKCCGDNLIQFDELMTKPLSAITVLEDFIYYLSTELIDVKNRKTISNYATLRALYDRYLNSNFYCGTNSAAFSYLTMEQFANLLGTYWSDIIEQVVPSTAIWGSVRIYTNTIFDQQKFKYKAYSSLLCQNPFVGDNVLSPINGNYGELETVEVSSVSISLPQSGSSVYTFSQPTVCDRLFIAQMNSGSEFIGRVNTVSSQACEDGIVINECLMQVSVDINDYTATAIVENAATPILYLWSNGVTEQSTTFNETGQYTLTVTDANCCSTTINFELPTPLVACWYSLPDTYQDLIDGFAIGLDFEYDMISMIVNGVEHVIVPPNYVLSSANLSSANTPNGLTYTNFVDFFNQAFSQLGLVNYSAQISIDNNEKPISSDYNGFYIIRPLNDNFSISVNETNNFNTTFTDTTTTGGVDRVVVCDNINLINGVVVE